MIHERTFECDKILGSDKDSINDCHTKIRDFLITSIPRDQSAAVTVRVNVGGEAAVEHRRSVKVVKGIVGWRFPDSEIGTYPWLDSLNLNATEGVLEVAFRPTPKPARVKWPEWLPDVTRAMISMVDHNGKERFVNVRSGAGHAVLGFAKKDEFGVWPSNQNRIATRTADGFVELSKCES